jgi:uncharacterized protein with beta-barrel porin domain
MYSSNRHVHLAPDSGVKADIAEGPGCVPAAGLIINGAAPPPDKALVSAGAELRLRNGWSLTGKFDGEFANRLQTYAGTGTVRYTW